jgi:hypothetical protein
MTTYRNGNKWTVNETLSLQREYELLEWTIQQIADKHQRSVMAILYRLEHEGFISSWNEARGFNANEFIESGTLYGASKVAPINEDYEEDTVSAVSDNVHVADLTDRMNNLEKSMFELNGMVKRIYDSMVSQKRSPLRHY